MMCCIFILSITLSCCAKKHINGTFDLLKLLHQTTVSKMYADIQGASEEKYHDENCIYFCPHVPDKYCEFLLKYQRP